MTGSIEAVIRTIIDRVYPVNVIVEFSVETDPNTVIGCGTQWKRFAAGRALIGKSDAYAVGWEGGETDVVLTDPGQNAPHNHLTSAPVFGNNTGGSGVGYVYTSMGSLDWGTPGVTESGGGKPHNNMQPSRAVDRWVRVA